MELNKKKRECGWCCYSLNRQCDDDEGLLLHFPPNKQKNTCQSLLLLPTSSMTALLSRFDRCCCCCWLESVIVVGGGVVVGGSGGNGSVGVFTTLFFVIRVSILLLIPYNPFRFLCLLLVERLLVQVTLPVRG
jgi:hypothetical protein